MSEVDWITDTDVVFEEELVARPSVPAYLRYIAHHAESLPAHKFWIYERAVRTFPGSYKLWMQYLEARIQFVERSVISQKWDWLTVQREWSIVNDAFERALYLLNKMPRLWLTYAGFLATQPRITRTRTVLDRALQALPVTQHQRVWELYLRFLDNKCNDSPRTLSSVWQRYIRLHPDARESYIELLIRIESIDEACLQLIQLLNEPKYVSPRGNSKYQLWTTLCDLVCKHSAQITAIDVEAIIRDGITRFKEHTGRLWCALARYFILRKDFERARDVYEQGLAHIASAQDFTQIFDAYAEFEESVLAAKIQSKSVSNAETALRLARFERLMDRRPFLINDALLRQNVQNVREWKKRIELAKEHEWSVDEIVTIYESAVAQLNPHGECYTVWLEYALFCENSVDTEKSREIFARAVKIPFKKLSDLAELYIAWSELELRNDDADEALAVLQRCLSPPPRASAHRIRSIKVTSSSLPVQARVFKCAQVWTHYLELEEALGTVETCRAAYDNCIELRVATPQIVLNCASYLQAQTFWEDSFKYYERGIEFFGWPVSFEIWNVYLERFVKRYSGKKIERARDLYEQSLKGCPEELCKALYIAYAGFEEQHGLVRNALKVLQRGCAAVAPAQRLEMYTVYLQRTTVALGMPACREIYENALETLPDKDASVLGIEYAEMERKLGEIDRARGVYAYTSQFCDPRTMEESFWQKWHKFEVRHGNEDTFKDMLRIKRSVQAKFNTEASYLAAQVAMQQQQQMLQENNEEPSPSSVSSNPLAQIDREAMVPADSSSTVPVVPAQSTGVIGFVSGGVAQDGKMKQQERQPAKQVSANPDEIIMGDDDEDSEDDGSEAAVAAEPKITQQAVPQSLFGSAAGNGNSKGDGPASATMMSAKERFAKRIKKI